MASFWKTYLFIVPMCILSGYSSQGQSPEEEYTLKAAFVYNFTKYINWGPSASENDFIIGIFGTSAIDEPLEQIAKTKTVNDKKIVIIHFDKPENISFCNILYIPNNVPFPLYSIITRVNHGTLTISETEGYAEQGTAFNFVLVKDKLRFESNVKVINLAGLKASSQLLKLAIIVE